MKYFIRIFCLCIAITFFTKQSCALVKEKNTDAQQGLISYTSFLDYPPFGKLDKQRQLETIYQPFIDVLSDGNKRSIQYVVEDTYEKAIFEVVSANIHILLGVYYDTEMYRGIQLLYPSIVNNPIVPVTLPDSDVIITSKSDLEKLKGAIDSREYFSDYVSKELKKLNVQEFDNSEKLYEQLFIGNIDYILTSRYYGALEQAKMGIRDMVQMAKTPIWDMPLFIGVSDIEKSKLLQKKVKKIKKILKEQNEDLREKINRLIVEKIHQADEASIGVVPPSFVK